MGNGHSKGIAFVEYEKEAEAAVALLKTDGTKLKGVELQVALSNPPKKEESSSSAGAGGGAPQEQVRSLGGTNQEPGPRGKGRSQLAFTPRVLSTSSTSKGQAAAKLQPMKFVKPA